MRAFEQRGYRYHLWSNLGGNLGIIFGSVLISLTELLQNRLSREMEGEIFEFSAFVFLSPLLFPSLLTFFIKINGLQNQTSNTTFYRARTSVKGYYDTHTPVFRTNSYFRLWLEFRLSTYKMVFVTCWLAFIAVSNVIGYFTKNRCDIR